MSASEHDLNQPNVDVLFEQMGGEAVPQRVLRDPVGQTRPLGRRVAYPVKLARGHRADAVAAGKHPHGGTRDLPPVAQQLQKLRRQHGKTVLAALALLDPQYHALGVDVAHL
jgi:hypothetical protein